jgi:phage-related minor tail protein
MRGGVGLMGEAGPEAIVPLARGADGKLGIRAGGGGGNVSVTMNISTPDAASFRRSQSQVAAEMSRAIQRGRRNL